MWQSDIADPAKPGFTFLGLAAVRTGEVVGLWRIEIDFDNALWIMPQDRINAGREHRVRLATTCIAVAARARWRLKRFYDEQNAPEK